MSTYCCGLEGLLGLSLISQEKRVGKLVVYIGGLFIRSQGT